jgi:hypothetical protein
VTVPPQAAVLKGCAGDVRLLTRDGLYKVYATYTTTPLFLVAVGLVREGRHAAAAGLGDAAAQLVAGGAAAVREASEQGRRRRRGRSGGGGGRGGRV